MDYYNEIEPFAVDWLRNLIDAGLLPDGVVDTRSIEDVRPDELRQFRRCHFFAGVGVWALALEQAGWPADERVWTGSCPCQPFSAAGKGAGFADERHLWPAWFHLIGQCRPGCVFGEQVASKDADAWIDLVQDDLEGLGYAVGAVPFPAAGVGAPHIRDRLYWVANAAGQGPQGGERAGQVPRAQQPAAERGGEVGGLGHPERLGSGRHTGTGAGPQGGAVLRPVGDDAGSPSAARTLGNTERDGLRVGGRTAADLTDQPGDGPLRGFWADAEWIPCRDGKWRPVEPGTFPLAHGASARVGRLRAYGNAIVAPQAVEFVRAYLAARAAGSANSFR